MTRVETPPSTLPVRVARHGAGRGAARAVARRSFRDARVRTIVFAWVFLLYAYVQPVGYRHTYTTVADRLSFARSFASNTGLRLFYGQPHDLATVNGYSAWRVGGTLAIAAAAFGLLAAVRAMRAEEEAGRMELVLAGVVSRRAAYVSALVAIGVAVALLFVGELAGFVAAGMPAGGSAYLALATVSVVPPCVGAGAVASQVAPTRRGALGLGGAVVGLWFLLRVVADTATGVGWLRWATPLGWAEEMRPFASPRPWVAVLPVMLTIGLLVLAQRLGRGRDIGSGLVPARDSADPRLGLLGSPTAQAFRSERGSFLIWAGSVGSFAFILGLVAKSVTSAAIPANVQKEIAKLGTGSIVTPEGYLAAVFMLFILVVSLFACALVGAMRREESEQQLDTLLAQPVSRRGWLGGRLALAVAALAGLSLVAGFVTWLGAAASGISISLPQLLEAGLNCLPVGLLFLGVAALAYALVPRASTGIAYALVTVMFLWQLVGSLVGAPRWLVDLTPFVHVGLVPVRPFQALAAAVMIVIGGMTVVVALAIFRRRDLTET